MERNGSDLQRRGDMDCHRCCTFHWTRAKYRSREIRMWFLGQREPVQVSVIVNCWWLDRIVTNGSPANALAQWCTCPNGTNISLNQPSPRPTHIFRLLIQNFPTLWINSYGPERLIGSLTLLLELHWTLGTGLEGKRRLMDGVMRWR